MKVLLVGSNGILIRELVEKFYKAGDQIFTLTGSFKDTSKHKGVFEQYPLPYDSENIKDVVIGANPDVTIFLGAYDESIDWEKIEKASMYYIGGLVNLLTVSYPKKTSKLIYLSSQEVFSGIPDFIDEDIYPNATEGKGLVLAQGELLCKSFKAMTGLDTTIIRLDNLYGVPGYYEEATDFISHTSIEALFKKKAVIDSTHTFSALHTRDAVEGIYKIIKTEECRRHIYHISSEVKTSESEIFETIKSLSGQSEIVMHESQKNMGEECMLSCREMKEEFNFSIRIEYVSAITEILAVLKKRPNDFIEGIRQNKRSFLAKLGVKLKRTSSGLLPLLENILAGAFFLFVDAIKVGGPFQDVNFYLLYVLIFGLFYGKYQSGFSAVLVMFFMLFGNSTGTAALLEYKTYIEIAVIFFVALVSGHLRDVLNTQRADYKEEASYLVRNIEELNFISGINNRIKSKYEEDLIEYSGTMSRIYDLTTELNKLEPGDVLFRVVNVVSQIMNTADVAVYQVGNPDYARLFSYTSNTAKQLGASFKYSDYPDLVEAMASEKIFINKSLKGNLPILASGIYFEGKLIIMIMLWGIRFEDLSLHHTNTFTTLSNMITISLGRANQYINTLANERYLEGTRIMRIEAFEPFLEVFRSAAENHMTECALLRFHKELFTPKEWNEKLASLVRATDHLGVDKYGDFYALLTSTSISEAGFVKNRMEKAGIQVEILEI